MQSEDTDVIVLLRDMINGVERRLTDRLGQQDSKLDAIHQEARKTNGRVTTLEDRERSRKAFWSSVRGGLKWVVGTLLMVAGTVPLWLPIVS